MFQRCLLSHPHKPKLSKVSEVSLSKSGLPVHKSAFRPLHSSHGVYHYGIGQNSWLRLVTSGFISTQTTGSSLQLCRLSVQLETGASQAHPRQKRGSELQNRDPSKAKPVYGRAVHVSNRSVHCHQKQVPSGCLHMRSIQWHLKANSHVPESLEKLTPIPKSLHKHLEWWLQEHNVLEGQPLQHARQIFNDASNIGLWSVPESKLHISFLELKGFLLALKCCLYSHRQHHCCCLHTQEGGINLALFVPCFEDSCCGATLRNIVLQAHHIPGW